MSIIITTTAPAKPTANQSTVERENVTAFLAVAAPAARVFAALADPTTHAAIDGTGWVQEAVDRAPLTEVGQIFRMDMHHPIGVPRSASPRRVADHAYLRHRLGRGQALEPHPGRRTPGVQRR